VEDEADAALGGRRHGAVEEGLLDDRCGPVRVPQDRDAVVGQAERAQLSEERLAAVVGVLSRVVGDPEAGLGAGRTGGAERAQEHRGERHERSLALSPV